MNGYVGSTFYDTINKFLIGLLLWLPVGLIYSPPNNLLNPLKIGILCVLFWLTGLFAWGIIEFYLIPKMVKWNILESIVSRNNKDWITQEYNNLIEKYKIDGIKLKDIESGHLAETTYTKFYLEVQKNGLLGNIPTLESLSAFFRNFFFVLTEWYLILPLIACFISNMYPIEKSELIFLILNNSFFGSNCLIIVRFCFKLPVLNIWSFHILPPLLGILITISILLREKTEKKIYSLVLEAYLLGCNVKTRGNSISISHYSW